MGRTLHFYIQQIQIFFSSETSVKPFDEAVVLADVTGVAAADVDVVVPDVGWNNRCVSCFSITKNLDCNVSVNV